MPDNSAKPESVSSGVAIPGQSTSSKVSPSSEQDSLKGFARQIFVDTTIFVPLVDFRNAKIADIMTALAKEYRLNFWIDPYIDKTATIRLENVRLNDVFRFLIKEYALRYENDGALLKVTNAPAAIKLLPRLVKCRDNLLTLDIKDMDITELIRLITDNCGVSIVAAAGISGNVSGYIKDAPFETGLRAVLNSSGFDVMAGNGLSRRVQPLHHFSSFVFRYPNI